MSTRALFAAAVDGEGRGMTTTPYAVPAQPAQPAPAPPVRRPLTTSPWLFWLPVPATVAMALLLGESFWVVSDGAPDLDPLYGLMLGVIYGGAAVMGLISLSLAAVLHTTSAATRAAGSLGSVLSTATLGLSLVMLTASGNHTDPALAVSTTAGDQVVWEVAAGVAVLVPLVALVVAWLVDRSRRA
ncbi:MAG: hypothetical protein JWN84_1920 [Nocardioides sp.]|nr:hypothetical protein [Nocardioides sp.]